MVLKKVGRDRYENKIPLRKGIEIAITVDKVQPGFIDLYIGGSLVKHCSTEDKSIVALDKATKTLINHFISDLQSIVRMIPPTHRRNDHFTQMELFE